MRTLTLFALLGLVACEEPAPPPVPGTIAASGATYMTVNGTTISQEMIDVVTERIPADQLEQMRGTPRWDQLIDQVAIGTVLYQQALDKKLHEDAKIRMALAMAERQVLASELLEQIGEAAVTDQKLQETYDARSVRYAKAQVHARHILVKEASLAEDLKKQLDAGADFETLAKEHSVDPGSKASGGDLGWFEKERMIPAFSDAAFGAEKGAIVGPVETRFGFHLIQVLDKRDKTPLEDVKDELSQTIKQEAIQAYVEDVQKSMTVTKSGEAAPAAGPAPAPHGDHDGHADH